MTSWKFACCRARKRVETADWTARQVTLKMIFSSVDVDFMEVTMQWKRTLSMCLQMKDRLASRILELVRPQQSALDSFKSDSGKNGLKVVGRGSPRN